MSGSNSVDRDTAFAMCNANQYWLPEILTNSDLYRIEIAAGFYSEYRLEAIPCLYAQFSQCRAFLKYL